VIRDPDPARLAQVAEVARRYLPAFLAGERAPDDLYADGVTAWRNIGEVEEPLSRPPSLARARGVLPELDQQDVRVHVHDRGFVVQAVTVGHGLRIPSVLLVTVEGGRITRFEQYADSAAAARFLAAAD